MSQLNEYESAIKHILSSNNNIAKLPYKSYISDRVVFKTAWWLT